MIQTAEALSIALAVAGPAAMLLTLLALYIMTITHPGATLKVGIL